MRTEPRLRKFKWSEHWYIVWAAGRASRRLSTRTRDKKEAERVLARFVAAQHEPPDTFVINDLLDAYLDTLKERRWYKNREYELRPIREHFGLLHPRHVNSALVRMYIARRRRKGKADSTIDRGLRALRAALSWAFKVGWIDTRPYIDTPGGSPPRERWLTREEAQKLKAACVEPHVKLFVLLALHTGARTRAILDLTWDRVDLERRLVMYPRAHERSRKRTAVVPINDTLFQALSDAQKFAVSDWVIEYRDGPVQSVKKGFQAAVRRAGISHCTRHDLRRTCATWLVQDGVMLAKVARFLGDSEKMIETVYGHHSPEYLRDAAKALEA